MSTGANQRDERTAHHRDEEEADETITGEAKKDDEEEMEEDDSESSSEEEESEEEEEEQESPTKQPDVAKQRHNSKASETERPTKKEKEQEAHKKNEQKLMDEFKSQESDEESRQKHKSEDLSSQLKEKSIQSGKNDESSIGELNQERRHRYQSFVRLRTEMFKVTSQASLKNDDIKDPKEDKGTKKRPKEDNKGNEEYQMVYFGDGEMLARNNSKNQTNKVRTQRYSALSWAPLSLLFQFKRIANIYFLLISILTFFPFSPKNPISMVGTFAMVLIFTMLKEAYEDYQRFTQDKEVNNKMSIVLNPDTLQFEQKKWEQIQPGDIVEFRKDLEAPADLAILYSSNANGVVYVDTMNLDGETNLKEKNALLEEFDKKKINIYQGEIRCDQANQNLDKWEAKINFKGKNEKPTLASIKNLLLRGCFVRNTAFGIGIVVYTGMNTKIMRNLKKQPHKVSNIMRMMNRMLYSVFGFQLCLIITFAACNVSWIQNNAATQYYLNLNSGSNMAGQFFLQLLVFWVAYSHLIPISLYVIIEVLKLGLASFVNKDLMMYDQETQSFARCRNSDLIEELGQVEMVFSDKTGTLTQNKMIFKKCQINGIKYGEPEKQEEDNPEGMVYSGIKEVIKEMKRERKREHAQEKEKTKDQIEMSYVTAFFENLALCNTVMCEREAAKNEIKYKASSPDELALAKGASYCGIQLLSREHDRITIKNLVRNEESTYQLIAEFPFDSVRKRMSVILRNQKKKYIILTKGADSVMLDRISYEKSEIEGLRDIIEQDLYNYSCEGLRTLMIAQRTINKDEFTQFNKIYTTLTQSDSKQKEEKLFALYDAMEHKLRYLGSTAIEDKLQDGVPLTIERMMQADIRFFMLTGDKLETAIEIAKSCKVIQDDMNVVILCDSRKDKILKKLNNIINLLSIEMEQKVHTLREVKQENQVVTIDGSTLALVLEDNELSEMFFHVGIRSKSIVCCRMSPLQKSQVVHLFKSRGKWITLAIGDGANDVSMIMEAHIGVGIKGKEGTQAVRSADFAISQFQSLLRLLLLHGRYGYMKVSQMICYYFYKNIVLVFTEFYFAIFNGFSGQIFFLDWLPMMYNAIFTSWCCLFAALMEQDVNEDYSFKFPTIYKAGQLGVYFNFRVFWKWIILALWHGVVCFYGPLLSSRFTSWDSSGHIWSHWMTSTMCFTFIIHLVLYKLLLETRHLNWVSIISGIGSILLYYGFLGLGQIEALAELLQPDISGIMSQLVMYGQFWLMIITIPLICLIPDLFLKLLVKIYFPSPVDIVLQLQKDEPDYNFRLHNMKDEIRKESKRRQNVMTVEEMKLKLEERKKSISIHQETQKKRPRGHSNAKLDHITETLQQVSENNATSGLETKKKKKKMTSDEAGEERKKEIKQAIVEEEEEDEQTESDEESSSEEESSEQEEQQEDEKPAHKHQNKKKQKVIEEEEESGREQSNRSQLDQSVRSDRNLLAKEEERLKNLRDQRKKQQQQQNQIAVKAKKGAKAKPQKNARDDHSMFSVSDVPSKIEPERTGQEHYLEYFDELHKDVNKNERDSKTADGGDKKPKPFSKILLLTDTDQIDKSAFTLIARNRTPDQVISYPRNIQEPIPKNTVIEPSLIVDSQLRDRPQTVKNDFLFLMGHPLESSRKPNREEQVSQQAPKSNRKKKKYVEKYGIKNQEEQKQDISATVMEDEEHH